MPELRSVAATRYVTPLREGGSLPGLVEADDDGLYVLKFRGAGQGVKALVAEIVAGELARALGLAVPEIVGIEIDPALGAAEPDPEIQDLITGSAGLNAGLDFLPGSLPYTPAAGPQPSPELAAEIVWLDALVTNVDRTPRNPNLLVWHDRVWLIDHGAALYFHHRDWAPERDAALPFPAIRDHVLLPIAASIHDADERMAARLDAEAVRAVVDLVPSGWADAERYAEYLTRRLASPRAFAAEAERARLEQRRAAA
jgi:HipA-like kinase